jgi:hypothetical protein
MFCSSQCYIKGFAVLGYKKYAIPKNMKSVLLHVRVLTLCHFMPEGINQCTHKLLLHCWPNVVGRHAENKKGWELIMQFASIHSIIQLTDFYCLIITIMFLFTTNNVKIWLVSHF